MSSRHSRSVQRRLEKYDDEGGIPLAELKSLLNKSKLSQNELHQFIDSADNDGDRRINYSEFLKTVFQGDDVVFKSLKLRKRTLNLAVLAVAPVHARSHQRSVIVDSGLDIQDGYNWGEADVDNYIEAYDCKPPPLFIPLITIVEIIVFAYYVILDIRYPSSDGSAGVVSRNVINSPFIYNPFKRHEAWRFLTYMLLHGGYAHLIFNCIIQLFLGTLLELVHKFWRVGLVYMLGVIAGSLCHSVTDPYTLLVGASGGCYALIGAHLATVVMNWNEMQKNWLSDPIKFLSSGIFRLFLILVLGGGDTGMAIYYRLVTKHSSVGFSAHFGGFIAGILIGIPILRNLQISTWEKYCFWICIIVYLCCAAFVISFNVFCANINMCPNVVW